MCLQLLRTKLFFFKRHSVSANLQPIDTAINISIGIDNRYQSITTQIFAIDWSSIININRLIDIDYHRLSIPSIGYLGLLSTRLKSTVRLSLVLRERKLYLIYGLQSLRNFPTLVVQLMIYCANRGNINFLFRYIC